MREKVEMIFESFIRTSTIFKKLEEESDSYNTECRKKEERIKKLKDEIKKCVTEKQECILSGQAVIEEKVNQIKNLQKNILQLETKIQLKEQQRRKAVGSIGGCKTKISNLEKEIKNLNERIDFLKNNRRAPSIEELKDYDFKRKKSVAK